MLPIGLGIALRSTRRRRSFYLRNKAERHIREIVRVTHAVQHICIAWLLARCHDPVHCPVALRDVDENMPYACFPVSRRIVT
jgi:hypothetical protein